MRNKQNVTVEDVHQTLEFTVWDLVYVKECFNMISTIKSLYKLKSIRGNYSKVLLRLKLTIETACVITLYKLFDNKGECLIKLIEQMSYLDMNDKLLVSIKLYNKFMRSKNQYLKNINSIEAKLNPMRNVFRAHNFPYRFKNSYGPEFSMLYMKKWANFAGMVFDDICKSLKIRTRVRHVYNKNLKNELKHFLKTMGEYEDSKQVLRA